MAGCNRKNWDELNITREDIENLKEALKKEEFRKLLSEYAEEVTDPKNRKQYQEEIIQLEAERGVDCTFVNPEPGFVVKTSVDGKKKAFVNISKNGVIGRPTYRADVKNDSRGLSWSIPFSQAPGREDHDNKQNRCVVYDVVFHPNTLHLAERSPQFKRLVVDTALSAVEDSYNVSLDKKNIKFPKMSYKGIPVAAVIRKRSKHQPVLTEEEIEFQKNMNFPAPPPVDQEARPVVRDFDDNAEKDKGRYTVPRYIVKHRTGIDLQEFTYDKNGKINIAIPKELVIEVNLPLLSSSKEVTLDVMEKSVHLISEKPVKYKLDIQLPYAVREEEGNAKFDKDRRMLIITLPVIKARTTITDLLREDSGVESDFDRCISCDDSSPIGSVNEVSKEGIDPKDGSPALVTECELSRETEETTDKKIEIGESYQTGQKNPGFLDADKHYELPSFKCNTENNNLCFVLNVKNVDPNSVEKKILGTSGCHLKFISIGSGFFPVFYSFLVRFADETCLLKDIDTDVWDNNVTVQFTLEGSQPVSHYFVGADENSLTIKDIGNVIHLENKLKSLELNAKLELDEDDNDEEDGDVVNEKVSVTVESADNQEIVIKLTPEVPKEKGTKGKKKKKQQNCASLKQKPSTACENKLRTLSESSVDEINMSPVAIKSILKNPLCSSYPDSNAEDYGLGSSIEASEGSELCLYEASEETTTKKTVRFNNHIGRHVFRMNSSILGQKKKNEKRSRNKRNRSERRISESENSEGEGREKDVGANPVQEVRGKKRKDKPGDAKTGAPAAEADAEDARNEMRFAAKKEDKIFEFKSDLIFDLDM